MSKKVLLFLVVFTALGLIILKRQIPIYGQTSSLSAYCTNSSGGALGYYVADQGKTCGRAPFCAGYSYDQANSIDYNSVKDCWDHRCGTGMCTGNIPLCCYEVERLRNPMLCIGIDRMYCHPQQCAAIDRSQQYTCSACG